METAFVCTEELWSQGFGGTHPLKPERLKRTYELLMAYRAFDAPGSHLVPPRPASREELLLFHTAEYVDAIARLSDVPSLPALSGAEGSKEPALGSSKEPAPNSLKEPALSSSKGRGEARDLARRYNFRPDETPVFPGMYEIEGLKVGVALTGARLIAEGQTQVAFSFAGGRHHARPALASGFCVFNDVAIAIRWLVRQGLRVAYVDIDVHHGDGVQAAFYDTDQVLTISLHQAGILFYPGTGFPEEIGIGAGYGYSINVPFGSGLRCVERKR